MPLADLMRFLSVRESTGTLAVSRGAEWNRLFFEKGRIISSSSSDPTEQLGHFLVSRNKITEEQLTRGMEVQSKTKVMLGKILVMIGAVSEDELLEMLERKCTQTLFSMFLWEEGEFEFLENQLPPVRLIPTATAVEAIVEGGLRWREEAKRLSQEYPSPAIRFSRTAEAAASELFDDPLLAAIYNLVDGSRTIADIIMQTHAGYHRILKGLDDLRKRNLIMVSGVGAAGKTPPAIVISKEQILQATREKLAFERWSDAINLLTYILNHEKENPEARSLLAVAEKGLTESIYQQVLPDSVPRLVKTVPELLKEKFDAEENFLISRINGRWNLKMILTVTPLREVDSLSALKRLLDRKIIKI